MRTRNSTAHLSSHLTHLCLHLARRQRLHHGLGGRGQQGRPGRRRRRRRRRPRSHRVAAHVHRVHHGRKERGAGERPRPPQERVVHRLRWTRSAQRCCKQRKVFISNAFFDTLYASLGFLCGAVWLGQHWNESNFLDPNCVRVCVTGLTQSLCLYQSLGCLQAACRLVRPHVSACLYGVYVCGPIYGDKNVCVCVCVCVCECTCVHARTCGHRTVCTRVYERCA